MNSVISEQCKNKGHDKTMSCLSKTIYIIQRKLTSYQVASLNRDVFPITQ